MTPRACLATGTTCTSTNPAYVAEAGGCECCENLVADAETSQCVDPSVVQLVTTFDDGGDSTFSAAASSADGTGSGEVTTVEDLLPEDAVLATNLTIVPSAEGE